MLNPRREVALVLVAPLLALLPIPPAHAASTCHGRPATIEASSGSVSGTLGDDVIVVRDTVDRVDAGDGDDLICLVDTRKVPGYRLTLHVDTGGGNDVVDASAAGARTSVQLGPGADSLTGSAFSDYVVVGTRPADGTVGDPGPYRVKSGAGSDGLQVLPGAVADARLGKGNDYVGVSQSYAGPESRFDLGPGEDTVSFEDHFENPDAGHTSLLADLNRDLVTWRGVTSTMRGVENVRGAARRVVLVGNGQSNLLSALGCTVRLVGGDGDDSLNLSSATQDVGLDIGTCSQNRLRAYGNAGDDYLEGGSRHDVLVGGPGHDRAFGGRAGRDRCQAERTWGKGCQR